MAQIRIEHGRILTDGLSSRTEENEERRRQAEERGWVQLADGTVVVTSGRRVG